MIVRYRPASMLAIALCLSLLAGCVVHSVRPFYTQDLLVDLPEIIGQWTLAEGGLKDDRNKTFTFTKDSLIPPGAADRGGSLTPHFFRIEGMLFLDLIAADPPQSNSFWWVAHVTPAHSVSKVILEEKSFKLIPLSSSWMEEAFKSRTIDLPAVWHSEQNAYLFTASSAEWVAFLKKYGKNPQAFPEKDALVFTRQEKSSR